MFHRQHIDAQAPAAAGLLAAGPLDPLIDLASPALDSRIALINPGALDPACVLLRRGYRTVSVVGLDGRVPAHAFDVVIIPRHASTGVIEQAVPLARRLLAPMGAIALRLAPDGFGALQIWARRQLMLNGFTAIRTVTAAGETLIGAELPLHGRLQPLPGRALQ